MVAALLQEGSDLRLPRVGTNNRRTGLYETLQDMGADIVFVNEQLQAGEPVADMIVKGSGFLKGLTCLPRAFPV